MTTLDDVLAAASLRIDVGGRQQGSGVLIAPTFVLTCAHVVEPAVRGSDTASSLVAVDRFGREHRVQARPALDNHHDLALVRLAAAVTDLPCAYLLADVERPDMLISFGFPGGKPDGEPTTFEVEGRTGGETPFIKFKAGGATPGVSGSALVNARTGALCGILKGTRDWDADRGGYGVGVGALLASAIFEPARAQVLAAHRVTSPWLEVLDARQRSRLSLDGVDAVSAEPSSEFVVEVDQDGRAWTVSSTLGEADDAPRTEITVDLNTVRAEITRLVRAWRSHDRIEDAEQARLIGQALYRAVFPGPVGDALEAAVFESPDARTDVSLHFHEGADPELVHLPWEQLYIPERDARSGAVLGVRTRATLSRVLLPDPRPPVVPDRTRMRVALVRAPDPPRGDQGRRPQSPGVRVADAAPDVAALLRDDPRVEVVDLGQVTHDGLYVAFEEQDYDVLHYVGYGRYLGREDQLALVDEDDEEDVMWLSPQTLDETLGERPPSLVVLQPCEGIEGEVPGDLAELAPRLLAGGVESVVACQTPLPDRKTSRKFVREFYEVVCAGGSIRRGAQTARAKLRQGQPWVQPAVFSRHPGDVALVAPAPGTPRPDPRRD